MAIREWAGVLQKAKIAIRRQSAFVPCNWRAENWVSGQAKEMNDGAKIQTTETRGTAGRQAAVRAKAKANKKPARDDFARVLLWQMIRAAQRERDSRRKLDLLRDTMTDVLEEQGFDLKEAEDVFEDLAKRYSNGLSPFRPKFQWLALRNATAVSV